MEDIESKLDQLMEMYMEDRARLLAVPSVPPAGLNLRHHPPPPPPPSAAPSTAPSPPPPTALAGAPAPPTSTTPPAAHTQSMLARASLFDKQCSEPNTPVAKTFERPNVMQRGNSDLGSRLRRKVALRHSAMVGDSDPTLASSGMGGCPPCIRVEQDNTRASSVAADSEASTLATEMESLAGSDDDDNALERLRRDASPREDQDGGSPAADCAALLRPEEEDVSVVTVSVTETAALLRPTFHNFTA